MRKRSACPPKRFGRKMGRRDSGQAPLVPCRDLPTVIWLASTRRKRWVSLALCTDSARYVLVHCKLIPLDPLPGIQNGTFCEAMASNYTEGTFRLNIRKNFLSTVVVSERNDMHQGSGPAFGQSDHCLERMSLLSSPICRLLPLPLPSPAHWGVA